MLLNVSEEDWGLNKAVSKHGHDLYEAYDGNENRYVM